LVNPRLVIDRGLIHGRSSGAPTIAKGHAPVGAVVFALRRRSGPNGVSAFAPGEVREP
jgi:hypothetical protein